MCLLAALVHPAAGLCRVHQGKDASHLICTFPDKGYITHPGHTPFLLLLHAESLTCFCFPSLSVAALQSQGNPKGGLDTPRKRSPALEPAFNSGPPFHGFDFCPGDDYFDAGASAGRGPGPQGCIGRGGGVIPSPSQGTRPTPSHCPPDGKCRLRRRL